MTQEDFINFVKTSIEQLTFYSEEDIANAYALKFFDETAIRILKLKQKFVIEVPNLHYDMFNKLGYTCKKGSSGWMRCELDFELQTPELAALIREIYNIRKANAVDYTFGCCNSFTQCSDNRACIHPNERFYLGCMYRKNLEAGRIFYGKNANNLNS